MAAGWVVVLNGAPRSGKSSIAAVIQETFDGPWMNLGVDVFSRQVTPRGIGRGWDCGRAAASGPTSRR
jgi:chloramphenicol 3-O-phosphotransferase